MGSITSPGTAARSPLVAAPWASVEQSQILRAHDTSDLLLIVFEVFHGNPTCHGLASAPRCLGPHLDQLGPINHIMPLICACVHISTITPRSGASTGISQSTIDQFQSRVVGPGRWMIQRMRHLTLIYCVIGLEKHVICGWLHHMTVPVFDIS